LKPNPNIDSAVPNHIWPTAVVLFCCLSQPDGRAQHGAREPRLQRGPVNSEVARALAVAWSALRTRSPRLSSLFYVNHVGVGVGLFCVVCLLSSKCRGGVLPWDPSRRTGPNGDAALHRVFQARPPTGLLRAPLCCCCYGSVLFSRRSPLHSSDRGRCRACALVVLVGKVSSIDFL